MSFFISLAVLMMSGCMPTAVSVKTEDVKPDAPKPVVFKPDTESEVKGISIEASAKESLVETLRSIIGNEGEVTWTSASGKPHVIDANGTQVSMASGTRIAFESRGSDMLMTFKQPNPNVSVTTGPFKLNAPVVSVLFKPDNSAEATVDIGFGIKKTRGFKLNWDSDPTPTQSKVAVATRPLVWCYTTPGCGPCEQAKRELSGQNLPFDVRFTGDSPGWVKSFPTFHWACSDGNHYKVTGWIGVNRLTELVMDGQKTAHRTAPVRALPQWSYSGGDSKESLIEHLLRDGIHAGKFSKDYLSRLSKDALVQLHSDDHNGVLRN